jgi:hypothetical protein
MNREVLKFYDELKVPVSKIIDRRPDNLSLECVQAACEKVYEDHRNKTPNVFRIVRQVHQAAYGISGEKFEKEQELLNNYVEIVNGYKRLAYLLIALAASLTIYGGLQ